MGLAAISATSTTVALQTGHYLAMPFAALFALGYLYVAVLVVREQLALGGAVAVAEAPPLAETTEAEVPTVPNAA